METPAPALPAAASPVPPVAFDGPPWKVEQRARLRRAARPALQPERVHWSVALLAAGTAASLLAGAWRTEPSNPRELLPVVVTTGMR